MPRETVASFASLNDLLKQVYRPLPVEDVLFGVLDENGRFREIMHEPGVKYGYVCQGCGAVEFDTNGVCTYCRRQRGT